MNGIYRTNCPPEPASNPPMNMAERMRAQTDAHRKEAREIFLSDLEDECQEATEDGKYYILMALSEDQIQWAMSEGMVVTHHENGNYKVSWEA